MTKVRELCDTPELVDVVELIGEPDDKGLATLYERVDCLVIASYHEGYCVPVAEAIAAGAHVVTTNAGNLPYIVDGVGRTVDVGDVEALASAIAELVDRLTEARRGGRLMVPTDDGDIDHATWLSRVEEHRRNHSAEAFREGFWASVGTALRGKGVALPSWLEANACE
jgi:glycosyltransferase involved in cell wall biosynthesis